MIAGSRCSSLSASWRFNLPSTRVQARQPACGTLDEILRKSWANSMFSPSLRRVLNKKYQDESLDTMEAQMKRLCKIMGLGVVTMKWDLISDVARVREAVESRIESLSSRAGIYNTICQLIPHLWEGHETEGVKLVEEYQALFTSSKTGHFEKPKEEERGVEPPSLNSIEILKRRWELMTTDHMKGFSVPEIRLIALYALLPPMIPSVFIKMRVVDSEGGGKGVVEKISALLVRGGYNMYDLSSGVMTIIHQRNEPYVVSFKVGKELRAILKAGGKGAMIEGVRDSKEIVAMLGRLFPDSRLSVRKIRRDYRTFIMPHLDERDRKRVEKWANLYEKLTRK